MMSMKRTIKATFAALRKWFRRCEAEGEVGLRVLIQRPHHFLAQRMDEAL